jgi:hypothetical protein
MRLVIRGKLPKKLKKPLVVYATRWYCNHLMSPEIYRKLHLTVTFGPVEGGFYGEALYRQPKKHNYRYQINIENKFGPKFTLSTLGHEVVHVSQYASMKYYAACDSYDPKRVRWDGTWYTVSDMDYCDYPWEVDAFGREQPLYYRMMTDMLEQGKI